MRPSTALQLHRKDIRRIVKLYHASNPRVFGSVIHGDETDTSDLDLLVDPTAETTLLDIARFSTSYNHC
jgi:predicted nucleotidyltransferase